jgi:hypothetical protein
MTKTLTLIAIALAAQVGAASAQTYVAPRTPDGQPDLQGIWKVRNRAAVNLVTHSASHGMPAGFGIVEGGVIPYQPWAAEKQKENFAKRAELDPLNKCFRPGVPRIAYLDLPFQIFQTAQYVVILYEWTQIFRIIPLDGSKHWEDIDFWNGDSRGRWEGDTLVVEVLNHNDQTWLDASGNFHSDELRVVERYTRTGSDTIRYDVDIEDPKVFTRPWKMSMPIYRETAPKMLEYQCQAEKEEASGEFPPLPTWYGQPPPASGLVARPYAASIDKPIHEFRPTEEIPRLRDGTPNLQGVWSDTATGASWGLEEHAPVFGFPGGPAVIADPPDKKLPYQEWARKEKAARLTDTRAHEDPTARCFVAGVPRTMYTAGSPMILQPPGYIVILYDRWSYRIIPVDNRPHLPDNVRLWMGDSIARWEGNTLVIDTTNLNGKSWLDEVGDVISHRAHVVERLTMVAPNRIEFEATVDDPLVYTRPWTMAFAYTRSRGDLLLEQACHEGNEAVRLMKGAAEKARQEGRQ